MSFLVRLTPTRHRTFSEHEKAVMVATWLAVNPTVFSDNILRFFICLKTAVQQQAFILWQPLRVKVSGLISSWPKQQWLLRQLSPQVLHSWKAPFPSLSSHSCHKVHLHCLSSPIELGAHIIQGCQTFRRGQMQDTARDCNILVVWQPTHHLLS